MPSTEGPDCLAAVLEEAERLLVTVHRVSQGSGVFLLTDRELEHMREIGMAGNVEVSLFARPNAAWDNSAMSRSAGGQGLAPASRGADQLVYGLDDIPRAGAPRFRSVLIARLGLLSTFGMMCSHGQLPTERQTQTSAM